MMWRGIVEEFREYLPVSDKTPVLTLNEGNTSIIQSRNLVKGPLKGLELYFKYEGLNPTGSFKDRGMAMAIAKALEEGSRAVICASTGNTSASAAAYAARAGMKCVVLIPDGKIAMGKLSQALIHGALVLQIEGNFDQSLDLVKAVVKNYPITLVNSLNPYRIQGQKTGAFEVSNQLGKAPTYHALPVGNAGNISAYWMGYKEYHQKGKIKTLPKMIGFQAAGSAPIVLGHPVPNPETVATAIRIGNPASWKMAEAARDESGGRIDSVTDDEILYAYKLIASREGVFCEPASAASLAGVIKLYSQGYFRDGDSVVCTLTGHGLKDPDNAIKMSDQTVKVKAEYGAVEELIKGVL